MQQSTYGRAQFRFNKFGKNSIWISIPTFSNNIPYLNTTTTQKLKTIINSLPSLRNNKIIVLDLRGNAGGNLSVIHFIIQQLYGGPYLKSLGHKFLWNNPLIWHHKTSLRAIKSYDGPFKNATAYEQEQRIKLLNALKRAYKNNQSTTVFSTYILNPKTKANAKRSVHAKVILVTDGRCGSACTWFVRAMKSIPGTIQVGRPTNVFAPTGNWLPNKLPSNMVIFGITTGVTMSPKTYLSEPIKPNYYYAGYMGNTKKLQRWILKKFG